MTAANVLLYVALIGFMIFQRIKGRPVQSFRALLALPVILSFIGWQDIERVRHLSTIDMTASVIGCAISLTELWLLRKGSGARQAWQIPVRT